VTVLSYLRLSSLASNPEQSRAELASVPTNSESRGGSQMTRSTGFTSVAPQVTQGCWIPPLTSGQEWGRGMAQKSDFKLTGTAGGWWQGDLSISKRTRQNGATNVAWPLIESQREFAFRKSSWMKAVFLVARVPCHRHPTAPVPPLQRAPKPICHLPSLPSILTSAAQA
jgi:hypothetical protein